MHSLNTDFIVPLETKLEAEEKSLTVRSLISCAVYGIIISINFFRVCKRCTSRKMERRNWYVSFKNGEMCHWNKVLLIY